MRKKFKKIYLRLGLEKTVALFITIILILGTVTVIEASEIKDIIRAGGEISKDPYTGALGMGYDVLNSSYYNPTDVKKDKSQEIISIDKLLLKEEEGGDPESGIMKNNVNSYDSLRIDELSTREYTKSLSGLAKASVQVGGTGQPKSGVFKGSVEASFDLEQAGKSSSAFTTSISEFFMKEESLVFRPGTNLADFLADNFKRDINDENCSAEYIFNMYGTHLLTDIYLGARSEFNFVHQRSETETKQAFKEAASASYNGIVSGTAELSSEQKEMAKAFNESSSYRGRVIGGSFSGVDFTSPTSTEATYKEWTKGIGENSVFIDVKKNDIRPIVTPAHPEGYFGVQESTALIPVWDLADNPTRRKSFETKFIEIAKQNGIDLDNLQEKSPLGKFGESRLPLDKKYDEIKKCSVRTLIDNKTPFDLDYYTTYNWKSCDFYESLKPKNVIIGPSYFDLDDNYVINDNWAGMLYRRTKTGGTCEGAVVYKINGTDLLLVCGLNSPFDRNLFDNKTNVAVVKEDDLGGFINKFHDNLCDGNYMKRGGSVDGSFTVDGVNYDYKATTTISDGGLGKDPLDMEAPYMIFELSCEPQ